MKIHIPPTLVKPILPPKTAKPPRPPRKAKSFRRSKSRKHKAAKMKSKSKVTKPRSKSKVAKHKSYKSKAARHKASKQKAVRPKSRSSKHKLRRKKLRYTKSRRRRRCCPRSYSSCSGCLYRSCRSKRFRRRPLHKRRRRRRQAKLDVIPKIDRPPITIKPPSKIQTKTPGIVIPPIPSPSTFVSKRSVTAKCRTRKSRRGKKRTKCKTVIPSCY